MYCVAMNLLKVDKLIDCGTLHAEIKNKMLKKKKVLLDIA